MSKPPKSDQYSDKETKERAEKALRGALKTPPMPHKPPKKDKRSK
jgi:hypothetical protein